MTPPAGAWWQGEPPGNLFGRAGALGSGSGWIANKYFADARPVAPCDNRCMSTPERPKRPVDFNQWAYQVFQEAIGEAPTDSEPIPAERPVKAARAGERPGGGGIRSQGRIEGRSGQTRAAKLTAEERSEVGKKVAAKRWRKAGD